MDLYTFQFHAENIDLSAIPNVDYSKLKILVTCANILNFEVNCMTQDNRDILKQFNSGKAVLFPSDYNNLVSNLGSKLEIQIMMDDTQLGIANIHWKTNFKNLQEKKYLDNSETYNIFNKAKKKIGTIKINLSIAHYGNNIQLPIIKVSSQITIHTPHQAHKFIDNKQLSERWSPLYISTQKAKRSMIDESMKLYAALTLSETPIEMHELLTSEYINKHLCGNKACPSAKKFREFGLGPLAPEGSGLGTVASLAEAKPSGLYGMSQAYGTLENYGAYGLFVKRKNKTKSTCGSPDCPFKDYYYQPPNTNLNKTKKCMCKNCHNSDKDNTCGKFTIASDTCGSPNCCKSTANDITKCPYINNEKNSRGTNDISNKAKCGYLKDEKSHSRNFTSLPSQTSNAIKCADMDKARNYSKSKPRQSAGADKYNPNCCDTKCPFSTYQQKKRPSVGNKTQKNNQSCCGCKECVLDNTKNREPPSNNIGMSVNQPSKDKATCGDVECSGNLQPSDDHGLCGSKVYPLDTKNEENNSPGYDAIDHDTSELTSNNWSEPNVKHMTVLTNDEGKTIAFSTETESKKLNVDYKNLQIKSKELIGSLSISENSDLYYLVSQLMADREQTQSLYNYFTADEKKMLNETGEGDSDYCRPRHHKEKKKKVKQTNPCTKNSCRALKYTTCSECGGYSRSGATCDNTDVSFSTISYSDSFVNTETKSQETTQPSTVVLPALKSKEAETKKTPPTKLAVKIQEKKHKKKSRFVYHAGEFYPGIHIGHKACVVVDKNVPAHMGWLWNIKPAGQQKRRKGWKPGVISKVINDRIIQHRKKRGIPDPPELKMLVPRKRAKVYNALDTDEEEEEEIEPKPTLKIQKKEGNYLITFNPLKNPKTLADNENPYIRCKPMQFLITKTKQDPPPIITQYSEYGEEENEMDYEDFYKGCICDQDTNILDSSSSESELNIEFTTPAGIIIPERMKKKKNVVHIDTQFKEEDFICADCPIIVPKQYKQRKRAKIRK